MKKLFCIKSLLIILLIATNASAEDAWKESPQLDKLKRGVINVFAGPLEIPKQTIASYKEGSTKTKHAWLHGMTGFVKGIFWTIGREGSAVWDILTFNLAVPENFEPLMKPEFVYPITWDEIKPKRNK